MWGAIGYGLRNIGNFSGRDARQTFWYFVLFVYIVGFAISMLASMPMMGQMFSGMFAQIKSAPQDPATTQAAMTASMTQAMVHWMPTMMWVGAGVIVFKVVLLGASFVRRLHDSGLPGWIAAIPVVLEAAVLAQMPGQLAKIVAMMQQMQADPASNPMVGAQTNIGGAVLGWLAILIVIVCAVRKSSDGANRYGEAPVRF